MTVNARRRLRLMFKFGLLVSLPLAGYLWALTGASPWSIGLGSLCLVMALGAEGLASTSEAKLRQLRAEADADDRAFDTEVAGLDEKIRQMDRVVETLSNQNHDLRGKLVSLHGEVHRVQEETEHLNLGPMLEAGGEPRPRHQPSGATEPDLSPSGEVTDITSLIKR